MDAFSAFTVVGLQHLYDRAQLRQSVAEQEDDFEESFLCYAEMMLVLQLAQAYGWSIVDGVVSDA